MLRAIQVAINASLSIGVAERTAPFAPEMAIWRVVCCESARAGSVIGVGSMIGGAVSSGASSPTMPPEMRRSVACEMRRCGMDAAHPRTAAGGVKAATTWAYAATHMNAAATRMKAAAHGAETAAPTATVESATPAGVSAATTVVSTATTAVPRGRCIGRHGGKHGNACQKSECKFVLHLTPSWSQRRPCRVHLVTRPRVKPFEDRSGFQRGHLILGKVALRHHGLPPRAGCGAFFLTC